jgi:hypothetical protein
MQNIRHPVIIALKGVIPMPPRIMYPGMTMPLFIQDAQRRTAQNDEEIDPMEAMASPLTLADQMSARHQTSQIADDLSTIPPDAPPNNNMSGLIQAASQPQQELPPPSPVGRGMQMTESRSTFQQEPGDLPPDSDVNIGDFNPQKSIHGGPTTGDIPAPTALSARERAIAQNGGRDHYAHRTKKQFFGDLAKGAVLGLLNGDGIIGGAIKGGAGINRQANLDANINRDESRIGKQDAEIRQGELDKEKHDELASKQQDRIERQRQGDLRIKNSQAKTAALGEFYKGILQNKKEQNEIQKAKNAERFAQDLRTYKERLDPADPDYAQHLQIITNAENELNKQYIDTELPNADVIPKTNGNISVIARPGMPVTTIDKSTGEADLPTTEDGKQIDVPVTKSAGRGGGGHKTPGVKTRLVDETRMVDKVPGYPQYGQEPQKTGNKIVIDAATGKPLGRVDTRAQ